MSAQQKSGPRILRVTAEESGQRLDNFLLRHIRGVPKTRVYRAIRKGEVRVNKGRSRPEYKVLDGDEVRIPPLSEGITQSTDRPSLAWERRIRASIISETSDFFAINKPPGLAVHGGSGVRLGLIESLRRLFPEQRYMELVHRLDRDTSGLVLVAKNARTLRELHEQLRTDRIDKRYLALVAGKWPAYRTSVAAPLAKHHTASGERIVKVDVNGKASETQFRVLERLPGATLIEAKPITGRTHQIRVHTQHSGHPILGDTKYETELSARCAVSAPVRRLFLHAGALSFTLKGVKTSLACPLSEELEAVLDFFRQQRQR
ncbi:MAG: RluA family pseudouridine synthase [Halieaceae bacterium]